MVVFPSNDVESLADGIFSIFVDSLSDVGAAVIVKRKYPEALNCFCFDIIVWLQFFLIIHYMINIPIPLVVVVRTSVVEDIVCNTPKS